MSVAKKTARIQLAGNGKKGRKEMSHSAALLSPRLLGDDPKYFLAEPRTELRKNFKVAFLLRVIFFCFAAFGPPSSVAAAAVYVARHFAPPPSRIFQRRTRFRRGFFLLATRFFLFFRVLRQRRILECERRNVSRGGLTP